MYPAAGSPADACDVPAASNGCEVVDKVLYAFDLRTFDKLGWLLTFDKDTVLVTR